MDPTFEPITDDPKLPRVLIIGDSVSIAYTLAVRKELAGIANVHRPPANCSSTKIALGDRGMEHWLADENAKWDIIHFNHGLHDLTPASKPTSGTSTRTSSQASPPCWNAIKRRDAACRSASSGHDSSNHEAFPYPYRPPVLRM